MAGNLMMKSRVCHVATYPSQDIPSQNDNAWEWIYVKIYQKKNAPKDMVAKPHTNCDPSVKRHLA
jgi:hypothetical protein